MDAYDICNELGKLECVIGHFLEENGITDFLISLEFVFENGRIFHEAVAETDEIAIKLVPPEDDCVPLPMTHLEPWKSASGRGALWAWELRNQQGYADGIQYSFANTVSDREVIVQLIVVASQVFIYDVTASHNNARQ